MKRILTFSFVLFIAIFIASTSAVYASFSGNVKLSAKTELSKNEEFVVSVAVSNVQTNNEFASIYATIQYNKNDLEFQGLEDQNGWSRLGYYNEETGELATFGSIANGSTKTILNIKFKVKDTNNANTIVKLVNIKGGDGDTNSTDIAIPEASIQLTIINNQGEEQNPGGNQGEEQNPGGNQGEEQNPGGNQGEEQNPGGNQGENQNPGGNQGGNQNPGGNQGEEQNPGENQGEEQNPGENQGENQNPGENQGGNNNQGQNNSTTKPDNKLPQTGNNNTIFIIVFAIIIIIAIALLIKIKIINNRK